MSFISVEDLLFLMVQDRVKFEEDFKVNLPYYPRKAPVSIHQRLLPTSKTIQRIPVFFYYRTVLFDYGVYEQKLNISLTNRSIKTTSNYSPATAFIFIDSFNLRSINVYSRFFSIAKLLLQIIRTKKKILQSVNSVMIP